MVGTIGNKRKQRYKFTITLRILVVYDCQCGRKFVKSRGDGQSECLFCLFEHSEGREPIDLRGIHDDLPTVYDAT